MYGDVLPAIPTNSQNNQSMNEMGAQPFHKTFYLGLYEEWRKYGTFVTGWGQ